MEERLKPGDVLVLCGNARFLPVTLEDGSWVGAGAIVTLGVTLKSHSVLAVGSVASKDLEAYTIYQGNPAVAVRERTIA